MQPLAKKKVEELSPFKMHHIVIRVQTALSHDCDLKRILNDVLYKMSKPQDPALSTVSDLGGEMHARLQENAHDVEILLDT